MAGALKVKIVGAMNMSRIAVGITQNSYKPAFFLKQNDLLLEPLDTLSVKMLLYLKMA